MEFSQLRRIIHSTPKGANIIVEWERPCTTFKGVSCVITKRVKMVGRIGIEYDNQKKVIEARQEGSLPIENQGLRGMEWVEYPWLIRSIKSFKLYLRLYNGTIDKVKPSVSFFKDGIEVPKEAIQHYLTAKELQSTENNTCFTCSVDSIISLNREKANHVCVEISNELVMF